MIAFVLFSMASCVMVVASGPVPGLAVACGLSRDLLLSRLASREGGLEEPLPAPPPAVLRIILRKQTKNPEEISGQYYIELLYLKYRLSASTNKTQPHCKKYFEKLNLNPHLVLATARSRSLSDSCEDRDTALGRANAPESRSLSLSRSLSRLLSCRP